MQTRETVQQQFAAAAERYAASSYHRLSPDLEAMLGAADLRGDERVLDVGTGTGHTALAFAPRVAHVVGVDFTPAMLAQARALAAARGIDNVRFDEGDALALPHPDDAFDLVTCRVCAHHFTDPARAVREVARVLRPGGRFLLVDSVAPEDPAEDTFFNAIELLRDRSHVRNHRVSEWLAMLRDVGFAAEHLETFAVPLDFDEWVERIGTPAVEREALRALFRGASDEVRSRFGLRTSDPWGFDVLIGLLRGVLR